jgi:hypothetical protein
MVLAEPGGFAVPGTMPVSLGFLICDLALIDGPALGRLS